MSEDNSRLFQGSSKNAFHGFEPANATEAPLYDESRNFLHTATVISWDGGLGKHREYIGNSSIADPENKKWRNFQVRFITHLIFTGIIHISHPQCIHCAPSTFHIALMLPTR